MPQPQPSDLQAVILCGGRGMRLGELTGVVPKPMVHIGERPILWHIMKHYSTFGVRRFVLCLGYLGHVVKDFFIKYRWMENDFTLRTSQGETALQFHQEQDEDWEVIFADTGEATETGGRVKKIERYIDQDMFFLTYGDGVGDVDLRGLLETHQRQGSLATLTALHPRSKYGVIVSRACSQWPSVCMSWSSTARRYRAASGP